MCHSINIPRLRRSGTAEFADGIRDAGALRKRSEAPIMRCAQAEKLIPLYAGDDLPGEQTVELRDHLESCAQCQRLVAEFEESRNWLINFSAPEFDEATLAGMRDHALEEIGRIEKRPRLLEWILPSWKPRFVFVASMALLLLIAALGTFGYRRQLSRPANPDQTMADKSNGGNKVESPQTGAPDNVQPSNDYRIASSVPRQRKHGRKPIQSVSRQPSQVEIQPVEPDLIAQSPTATEPASDQSVNAGSTQTDLAVNRNMLRIEIQTADPNIRIIWLAPTDSNSNRPNTNVR